MSADLQKKSERAPELNKKSGRPHDSRFCSKETVYN